MGDFKTKSGVVIVELQGVSAFLNKLKEMPELVNDVEVRAGYMGAGKGIADSVRKQAPVNKYPYSSIIKTKTTSSKPGLLRKSIIGKAFNLPAWRRWGPGAFAQVTLRMGAANRAPHANILKPGRKALEPKKGKRFMVFMGHKGIVFKKKVAAVPPNDFWGRGVRGAEQVAVFKARQSIERAWNRRVAK